MNLFRDVYFNYFGLVATIAFFQWGLTTAFLASLKNKSKPAWMLFFISFCSWILASGYIVSQVFFIPTSLGRVLVFSCMIFIHVSYTQFVLNFPEQNHPRFAKYSFYIQFLIAFLLSSYAIFFGSRTWKLTYDFEAHYYEVEASAFLRICGLVMLTIVALYYTIPIWYSIKYKGEKRKAYLLLLPAIFGSSVVPIVLNMMNKNGNITREVFMNYYTTIGMIGFFMLLIVFINNTTDRTTFMLKIVSTGFLSFVLIFNIVCFIIMSDREITYNQLHANQIKPILDSDLRPSDLKFIMVYDPAKDQFTYKYKTFENNLDENQYKHEIIKSYFFQKIKDSNSNREDLIAELQNLNILDKKYLSGYENLLLSKIKDFPPSETQVSTRLAQFIESNKSFVYYRYIKIKELPEKDFRKNLILFLSKEKEDFSSFKSAMESYINESKSEDSALKEEILNFVSKAKFSEERKFRTNPATGEYYISFNYMDYKTGLVYDIGFSYIDYRKYIHEIGLKLFFLMMAGIIIFVLGAPIFLSGALVNPLMELLEGLKKVRKGDLNIEVPIRVQDEIGFLASSFNTMVKSIKEAKEKLEEYSQGLEVKVEERTEELKHSLDIVNKLKSQQDGDYFLTSLLLNPFVSNNASADNYILEHFVSQKKKFEFHGKKHEIGGDLCNIQNIIINGKNYIVFFNADSMGKSLQGAGGAIVFGSVFFSIVERTNQNFNDKDASPERWLKNAFVELHKVFLAFDGSMLVSAVIGLVEESTGLMYYINAEHPWITLYRDGVCDFIENETHFFKLGSSINANKIFVSMLRLHYNDSVIIGSDGRDDFAFKENYSEDAIAHDRNFDERVFLKIVEEAKGEIKKIYQITQEKGIITDDYSLIKIQCLFEPADLSPIRKLAVENYNKKNFKTAVVYAEDYINGSPWDTEIMASIGYMCRVEKEYEKAAQYSERVRLREPKNLRNLFNLVQTHIALENLGRAESILEECKELDSNNKKITKLEEMIENQRELSSDDEAIRLN